MMKALIDKHLSKAFSNQLQDAIYPFVGTRKGAQGALNPITGTYATSADIVYSGRGTLESYNNEEIQNTQIEITDVTLSCLQSELSIIPKIDDIITIRGQKRRVLSVIPDGIDAMWIIELRGMV